jgi:hypothetical protein
MRFRLEHTIAAARNSVEAAYLDPGFYVALGELEKIDAPLILSREDDGAVTRLRLRYAFTGELPAAARAVLDPQRLTWVQESTVHRDEHRTDFVIRPDHYGRRLRCAGSSLFEEASGGAATRQCVEGEVKVHWPIVGGAVERALVSGLEEHLREEAQAVARWVAARS